MPISYLELKTQGEQLIGDFQALIAQTQGTGDLTNGYTFYVTTERRGATVEVKYWMEGPETNVNLVPRVVLNNYFQKARRMEQWYNGAIHDFPDPAA